MGALTSKTYEFKARNWELKNVFGFDISNSESLSVILNYRNNEILRIIPRYGINTFIWINDKFRFFYLNLKYDRLFYPLYNLSSNLKFISINNISIIISWFFFLTKYLNIFKYYNLKPIFNYKFIIKKNNLVDLVDNQILLYLSHFSSYFRIIENCYMIKLVDFKNYFELNSLKYFSFLIIFNLNLRLEFPFLELKLREYAISKIFKLYFISSNLKYINYSYFYFGNNFYYLWLLLNGKLNIILKDKGLCLIGLTKLNFDNLYMYKKILKNYLKNFEVKVLISSLSVLNNIEIGSISTKLYTKSFDDIIYRFEINNISFNNYNVKSDIIFYFGGWGFFNLYFCTFVLPIPVFSEYNNIFIDVRSYIKENKKIFKPLGHSKRLRKYFLFIFKKFISVKEFEIFFNVPFMSLCKNLKPNNKNNKISYYFIKSGLKFYLKL